MVAVIEFFSDRIRVTKDAQFMGLIASVAAQVGSVIKSKLTEDALREAREFLSSLLENAPMPIFVLNADDRYRLVNRAWEEFSGKNRSQVIGQHPDAIYQIKLKPRMYERNRRLIETGLPNAELFPMRSLNGQMALTTFTA